MTTEQYKINGVIDTERSNMENLQILANNCGSWISYDENSGKWGVVINESGASTYSFTDDDIIGAITIASSALDSVYNSVEVTYPNQDINGGTDSITLVLPSGDWYTNELPNQKQLNYSLCDNSIQAQYLAYLNLNQSRMDEVVRFIVSFGSIDIKAGNIFDITNTAYSWTNRKFRALKVVEKENDGDMFLEITGVQYDDATYDITNIVNYDRIFNDGILSIGSIGQAGTPQVTKFESGSRPHVLIESTVPDTGDSTTVVTNMEYWVYIMPESELANWELLSDAERTYTLHTTQTTPAGTFEPGDTSLIDVDSLNDSDFLVKTRARNDKVTGPYSETSGLVTYLPEVVPDAITPEVEWKDLAGNFLAGYALTKLLDDMFNGNLTGPGSLYDTITSLFGDDPDITDKINIVFPVKSITLGTTASDHGMELTDTSGAGDIQIGFTDQPFESLSLHTSASDHGLVLSEISNGNFELSFVTAGDPNAIVTYDNSSYISPTSITDVFFKTDGTKMYTISGTLTVLQHTLSTAWDLSTVTSDGSYDISNEVGVSDRIYFSDDGTKMYAMDSGNIQRIFQYTLGTAWDITTASFANKDFTIGALDNDIIGFALKENGTKIYAIGFGPSGGGIYNKTIYQYSLSTPWDITTDTYDGIFLNMGISVPYAFDLDFSSDGTILYVCNSSEVAVFSLSTPWDVSSGSLIRVDPTTDQAPGMRGIYIKPDSTKLYIVGSNTVFQYSL